MSRIYAGLKRDGSRQVFTAPQMPRGTDRPEFESILGPFGTRAEAAEALKGNTAPSFRRPMGAGSEVRARAEYRENGAKMRVAVEDFASADAALRLHRVGRDGTLGHNTRLVRDNVHTISVILHNTRIVTYHDNGMISLNSGGYQTATTKARMNEVLPQFIRVEQKGFKWSVRDVRDGSTLPFTDGMLIRIG